MRLLLVVAALAVAVLPVKAADTKPWAEVLDRARGQTVYWNAWGGDDRNNAFIAWAGEQMKARYGITLSHVKLNDTGEAVTRVIAEKAAGRTDGGTVDLIWINGPNFVAMKSQGLLYGPFAEALPNFKLVDTVGKPSTIVDFTVPVAGMASPWLMAQVVFVYDAARSKPADLPRTAAAMLAWAKAHPGRLTHPTVSNFLGVSFLKQALVELTPDPTVLQTEATDATFASATERLWTWYDALKPNLWRSGREFPENGPAMRQLFADGELDLMISFNPAEAVLSASNGLIPVTARVATFDNGTLGNTSFVAIPFNAAHKEAAMALANFLLEPEAQARAQDPTVIGLLSVLDMAKVSPDDRKRFDLAAQHPGMPNAEDLGRPLLEPHPSWATRLTAEWQKRYVR
jgi:putative thiamine transport system substrate-binding protein